MNSRAHRFSGALAAVVLMLSASALPAPAQERAPALWFQGTRLILDHPAPMQGDLGVSTADPGLHRFLDRLGATVAYSPAERYVVVTSQDRRTIVFTLGDTAYTVAGVRARAPFAPLADGNDAVLPFYALARALHVEPVVDGGETVLQPRIGALDVRTDGSRTVITLRAAMPLVTSATADGPDRLQISFVGQGSSLTPSRRMPGTAVEGIDVAAGGSARVPTTTLTISAARGATHRIVPAGSSDAFAVVFESRGAVESSAPPAPPAESAQTSDAVPPPATASPVAAPLVVAGRATVTDVTIEPGADDALAVRIALSGAVGYEWHRLLDNRWYIDFRQTTLNGPGRDEHPSFGAVQSVRVRQIGTTDAPSVRVAFTLSGQQRIDLAPSDAGVVITVGTDPATEVARTGVGRTGGAAVVPSAVAVDPNAPGGPSDAASPAWKYGANTNARLIVIDPGHGGADTGTAHNGLVEKELTFDIALRLRSLLVAQGWVVKLTRDTDIDPVSNDNLARMRADGKPNADDRAYLQTRCDVANDAGARLFISIHVNSAPSTSPHGTTFYWYKPQDAAFAQALERNVIPAAGTQDDGTRHENFYVVRHTTMPAVLIETAFVTNLGDVALLRQPAFLQSIAAGIANGVKAYTSGPSSNALSERQ